MNDVQIRAARLDDCPQLGRLRHALWPESSVEEHTGEVKARLTGERSLTMPFIILVAESNAGSLIGFVEVGLRSHADGCDETRPVGFLEGWFVAETDRRRGIGGQLVKAAEVWAQELGCREMASDALITNSVSQQAHLALGFEIVDRCVHFRKPL